MFELSSSVPGALYPSISTLQAALVLLDVRAGSRIETFLGTNNNELKGLFFKLCCRVLSLCMSIPEELRVTDPFAALASSFTTQGWVQSLADVVHSGKKANQDLFMRSLQCLRLMSSFSHWMRNWNTFEILPLLCFTMKQGVGKREAQFAIIRSCVLRPWEGRAMVDLRVPHSDCLDSTLLITRVNERLRTLCSDARDLSFGSTLSEQAKFTQKLCSWIGTSFPYEYPTSLSDSLCREMEDIDAFGLKEFWSNVVQLGRCIASWLPKLCLSLEIVSHESGKEKEKKDKTNLSCKVALKQLRILERIILNFFKYEKHTDYILLSDLFWISYSNKHSSSNKLNDIVAQDEDESNRVDDTEDYGSGGLLACLDQLTASGTYVDTYLALQLKTQICITLLRVINSSSQEYLTVLCGFGLIRSICRFYRTVAVLVRDVSQKVRVDAYSKQHKDLVIIMRSLWYAIIRTNNPHICEDILSYGLLQMIVEDWLQDSTSIQLSGLSADDFNPLILKFEAITMLRLLIILRYAPTRSDVQELHIDRLISSVAQHMIANKTIYTEMKIYFNNKSNKQVISNARKTALAVLYLAVIIEDETLNDHFKVN